MLDNCEHLVEACAALAEELLRACPDLRLLATSREPLGVPGERVFRTGSLAVPATGDRTRRRVARADAGAPVRRSARRRSASFELDARHRRRGRARLPQARRPAARDRAGRRPDRVAVAGRSADRSSTTASRCSPAARGRRCRASGRSRRRSTGATSCSSERRARAVRPAVGVRRRLDARRRRDGVRRRRHRDAPRRRRSGRAGRQVARRARCARGRTDALPAARDAPAVRARTAARGRRGATAVRDAHLSWAVGLAEEAERHLDGLEQAAWLDRLERELDNLRAALEWAITSRNAEAGLRVASITIGSLWTWRSHVPEGQRWLQRLLATPAEVAVSVRAKGLLAAGRVDFQAGQWTRGVHLCAQSRELYREAREAAGEARALIWLAFNRWGIEDDDEIGERPRGRHRSGAARAIGRWRRRSRWD